MKTKKELKEEIEELRKSIEYQQKTIEFQQKTIELLQIQLEQKINYSVPPVFSQDTWDKTYPVYVNENLCIDGGMHQYDYKTTGGNICSKCGKQAPDNSPTFTMQVDGNRLSSHVSNLLSNLSYKQ